MEELNVPPLVQSLQKMLEKAGSFALTVKKVTSYSDSVEMFARHRVKWMLVTYVSGGKHNCEAAYIMKEDELWSLTVEHSDLDQVFVSIKEFFRLRVIDRKTIEGTEFVYWTDDGMLN